MRFTFDLHSAAVLAPGLGSLAQLRAVAHGSAPLERGPLALPAPALLPSHERRRASQGVRLVLACIEHTLEGSPYPADSLPAVFASDEGTGEVCQQMLESLATTRQVSPLVFSNSVLNAPSGYFSIAWRNREPATVVSLGAESFAAGLFAAVAEMAFARHPVLLVSYDPAMSSPLDECLPIVEPVAAAWIIAPAEGRTSAACGSFALDIPAADAFEPSPLPGWMPQQWSAQSSARALAATALIDQPPGASLRLRMGTQALELVRL